MDDTVSTNKASEQDLRQYLYIIWRRKWIVLLTVVLVTAAALLTTLFLQTPKYQSSTELLQRRSGLDKVLLGSDVFQASPNQPERELQTAAELVLAPEVVQAVNEQLGDRLGGRDPKSLVSVSLVNKADILRITAVDSDPQLAADVANTFANEYIEWRRSVDTEVLEKARASVQAQISALPLDQRQSETDNLLQDKLETLQLIEFIQTGGLEVVKQAAAASTPSSPKPVRSGLIAFFISLVGGVGLAVVVNQFDTRIRDAEDIGKLVNKPVLAMIPDSEYVSDRGSLSTIYDPSGPDSEAYRILKTNLGYAQPDKPLRSILVSSAEPSEGKSTLVANLAVTWARAGKRVIVLDVDLRRPKMHKYLNLRNRVGISNVIAGEINLAEAIQMVDARDLTAMAAGSGEGVVAPIAVAAGGGGGSVVALPGMSGIKPIYCATSGPIPPNPGEMADSEKMGRMIAEASQQADIVIIDSPPLGIVADAAGLASKVDGIVLVAKMGQSSKRSLGIISNFIQSVPGNILGMVITNASAGRGYSYKYQYYQQDEEDYQD